MLYFQVFPGWPGPTLICGFSAVSSPPRTSLQSVCAWPAVPTKPSLRSPALTFYSTSSSQSEFVVSDPHLSRGHGWDTGEWQILPEMERLWEECEHIVSTTSGRAGLLWRDTCLWWKPAGSTQGWCEHPVSCSSFKISGDSLGLLPVLPRSAEEEPAQPPPALPEGRQVREHPRRPQLHVQRRGQHCPGRAQRLPLCGRGPTGGSFLQLGSKFRGGFKYPNILILIGCP